MKCTVYSMLKIKSPLHIAAPSEMRVDPATGKIKYSGGNDGTIPCTSVQKMTIVGFSASAKDESQNEETEGSARSVIKLQVPVIAGNNIAGRLRRQAGMLVLKAVEARGEKVDLSTFSVLMSGSVTGNPDGKDVTYQEYLSAKKHPYFGLFGGGAKMLRRNMRVCTALPMITLLGERHAGFLRHPLANEQAMDLKPMELTTAWTFRRNDDLKDLSKVDVAEVTVANFLEKFEARQATMLEEKNAKAAKKESGEKSDEKIARTSTQTFSALEFVTPGVIFDLTFELDLDNPAQLGLFLQSFDNFVANERLGGYSRNGFGQFEIKNMVMEVLDNDSFFNGQTTIPVFENGRLNTSNPVVASALDKWAEAAKNLSAAELDRDYGLSGIKEDKKAMEKAEKAAAKAAAKADIQAAKKAK